MKGKTTRQQMIDILSRDEMSTREVSKALGIREKEVFELLLSVSRIGPKLAISILSGIQAPELARALSQGDNLRLQAIPGVGKKAAERMIVELKDKAAIYGAEADEKAGPLLDEADEIVADAISALSNLGYNRAQAEKAINKALENEDDGTSLENLLKEALRCLAQ